MSEPTASSGAHRQQRAAFDSAGEARTRNIATKLSDYLPHKGRSLYRVIVGEIGPIEESSHANVR